MPLIKSAYDLWALATTRATSSARERNRLTVHYMRLECWSWTVKTGALATAGPLRCLVTPVIYTSFLFVSGFV